MKSSRIALGNVLDAEHGATFRKNIQQALVRNPQELEVDCSQLTYIDSTGLGLLTLARTEAQRINCKIRLTGVCNHPRKVLEMMKFDQLFSIDYAEETEQSI